MDRISQVVLLLPIEKDQIETICKALQRYLDCCLLINLLLWLCLAHSACVPCQPNWASFPHVATCSGITGGRFPAYSSSIPPSSERISPRPPSPPSPPPPPA